MIDYDIFEAHEPLKRMQHNRKNLKCILLAPKFWRSFPFFIQLNRFCTKGLQHQENDLWHRHSCVDSLSPVHTLSNLRSQEKQIHQLNMDFYSCLYFYSDQSVSVVPRVSDVMGRSNDSLESF